jgi:transposase InsO family protein
VIDLATRMVIGRQLAEHMRTSLIVDALQMGIDTGLTQPQTIFHSDRGTQYTSTEFHQFCNDNLIRASLGRTGVGVRTAADPLWCRGVGRVVGIGRCVWWG